jgi:signal transduction histidine kinase
MGPFEIPQRSSLLPLRWGVSASRRAVGESFQSRVGHDLRTPLNAIKGYSELHALCSREIVARSTL